MSDNQTLRPIGTVFEVVTEQNAQRFINCYEVVEHAVGVSGVSYEIVEWVSVSVQPKRPPTPSERK